MKLYLTMFEDKSLVFSIPEVIPTSINNGRNEFTKIRAIGHPTMLLQVKDESDPNDDNREHDLRYTTYKTLVEKFDMKLGKQIALELREWPKP